VNVDAVDGGPDAKLGESASQAKREDQSPVELVGAHPPERRSLPREVAGQLIELIASAGVPEVLLPAERNLCEQLGVSRNVLREALSELEGQGVTETRHKKRVGVAARARAQLVARMQSPNSERQLALGPIEARQILEPEIARLAARRATSDAIDEVERWLTAMEQGLARGERVVEYDSAFHVAIARAAGNPVLVQVVGALTDALRESRELSFQPADGAEAAIQGHRAILSALRAGDAPRARQAMRAHLKSIEQLIKASLRSSGAAR